MKIRPRALRPMAAGACALLIVAWGPVAAQETGSIVGEVYDGLEDRPIVGAVISVHNSSAQATSDQSGTFELRGLPAGETVIRVEALGYSAVVETLWVHAGRFRRVRFELWPVAFALDELVVSARRRLSREGIDTASARAPERPDPAVATDLLREVTPGVFVLIPNGYMDSSVSVLIRGIKSVTMSSEPEIYLDGIRVTGSDRESPMPGGRALSILDQLSASDIAEIRLLRGPAASLEYPQATNGVILIRTR
jgi:hypothetical protein